MKESEVPFADLGNHLKNVREQSKRSLAEVSGAIEIDERQLELIESGKNRPDEDIMLLLISYFNVQDQEALHLWELADYDSDLSEHLKFELTDIDSMQQLNGKPMLMLLAMDIRTMYSDGLDITINPAGVTMQFTQSVANQSQPAIVSRVGMSYQQAEMVLRTLQQALLKAKYNGGPKQLPPSEPQA